jgi:predicted transglutaminase-like cysteine proteinase
MASLRLALVLAALAAIWLAPRTSLAGAPRLFGTSEVQHENAERVFLQWRNMLARMRATPEPFEDACEARPPGPCHLKEWNAFLLRLSERPAVVQLTEVNDFLNGFPYVEDIVNWGVSEYWETPLEFLHRSGDCEDYAIAKYMSLRFLGWPAASLRIVVLDDLNLRIAHAVLAVYQSDDILILDNQIRSLVYARAIRHYRPVYSLNELHWWTHRGG